MRNKHLRMLWGIVSHPFKVRKSYDCLKNAAYWRAEQKRIERDMYMYSLLKK